MTTETVAQSFHERLSDALGGKPAASIRYSAVTGKWGVDTFHENGVYTYQAFHSVGEALDYLREELGE